MEEKIFKKAPLNLLTVQVKTRSLFEDLKVNIGDPEAKLVATDG
jgi:hypothetical protein